MANARGRSRRSPEIVFVTTFALCLIFGLLSLGQNHEALSTRSDLLLSRRSTSPEEAECRSVHGIKGVQKQCAFVRANCEDEDAGLISYLQFYYCTLGAVKPCAFFVLVVWISLLFSTIGIAASDFLCINLSTIATILGMSESLTGVTFLAFGNGSPDVFSTFAAMKSNSGSLAVGELLGAAGFITTCVAGSMALVKPFQVARKSFVRDVGMFTIAASFSMVFLWDGKLRLWECIAMVGFYSFYVVLVVVWHWLLQRRRRQKLSEIAARSHHNVPQHEELQNVEIDLDEEARPTGERSPLIQNRSSSTVPTLSNPVLPAWSLQEVNEEDEIGDEYLAELRSNMKVRAGGRGRRNTIAPIRPSLVGIIEFRNVMSALERKSLAGNSRPINLWRYSDDEATRLSRQQHSTNPYLAVTAPPEDLLDSDTLSHKRSMTEGNVAATFQDSLSPLHGSPDTVIHRPPHEPSDQLADAHLRFDTNLVRSPGTLSASSGASSPSRSFPGRDGLLAPPNIGEDLFRKLSYDEGAHDRMLTPMLSPHMTGHMNIPVLQLPQAQNAHTKPAIDYNLVPCASPLLSRPPSIRLPSRMSIRSGSTNISEDFAGVTGGHSKHIWWPHKYLPAPEVILRTLFPTLCGWAERTWSGRLLGICTAPSIFLLTITLPVVDAEEANGEAVESSDKDKTGNFVNDPCSLAPDTPTLTTQESADQAQPHLIPKKTDHALGQQSEKHDWNRWLVIVQLFTAPLFIVSILWANLDESHSSKELLIFVASGLIFSLVGLLLVLVTTSPDRDPSFRPILCFLGFLVSIAWISTIAGEVVGVLKAFGVILNMSDAILGLTIFAVGNSLGDLVADITVSKLGFPVMALSACIGGPMLNILLGIGLGGMYMTIQHSQHKHHKHPDRPVQYKPYELDVSTTLIVSGITLLVTLVALLIVVPLNGWKMDRKIGIGLILLWSLSTLANIICEVLGLGTEGATMISTTARL